MNVTGRRWGCSKPARHRQLFIHYNGVTQRLYVSNGPFPCFDQFRKMADTLDGAGVTIGNITLPCVSAPGSHQSCDPGGQTWSAFDAIKVRQRRGFVERRFSRPRPYCKMPTAVLVRAGSLQVAWSRSGHPSLPIMPRAHRTIATTARLGWRASSTPFTTTRVSGRRRPSSSCGTTTAAGLTWPSRRRLPSSAASSLRVIFAGWEYACRALSSRPSRTDGNRTSCTRRLLKSG